MCPAYVIELQPDSFPELIKQFSRQLPEQSLDERIEIPDRGGAESEEPLISLLSDNDESSLLLSQDALF